MEYKQTDYTESSKREAVSTELQQKDAKNLQRLGLRLVISSGCQTVTYVLA